MTSSVAKLVGFFSDYRGEWSAALFGDLFIAPPYFAKLEIASPCFLVGGRGTGKTTALRSLRFDASAARLRSDGLPVTSIPYFGIYIRTNKNRIRAFQGSALGDDTWNKAFAHYFNLVCAVEFCRLADWLGQQDPEHHIDVRGPAASFGLADVTT